MDLINCKTFKVVDEKIIYLAGSKIKIRGREVILTDDIEKSELLDFIKKSDADPDPDFDPWGCINYQSGD